MQNRAVFLDRDNTLIEDPGYIDSPRKVRLIDNVAESLREIRSMGYKLVIVSNQSGVARGLISEKVLGQIHDRLRMLLAKKAAFVDAIYYCPYHPDGIVPKYRKESELRKPNPGMVLKAAGEMDIDLSQSWMIGNSSRDIEAGSRAGCKTIRIDHNSRNIFRGPGEATPDYEAVNMKEAANIIKKHNQAGVGHRQQELREPPPAAEEIPPPPAEAAEKAEEIPPPPAEAAEKAEETVDTTEASGQTTGPAAGDSTHAILADILQQLKVMHRQQMFDEFSMGRLLAGLLQVVVLFCLVLSVWFLTSPVKRDGAVFITIGFAAVLQLMALTFYTIHGRK
jgi:D,D-heptose 1,7-bisphosphate phosphatase